MPAVNPRDQKVVIIGGGPAGLTAAYQLSKVGAKSIVLEKDSILGGISRTVEYKGYHFDIGGHRFFTKVSVVDKMWREVHPKETSCIASACPGFITIGSFSFIPSSP